VILHLQWRSFPAKHKFSSIFHSKTSEALVNNLKYLGILARDAKFVRIPYMRTYCAPCLHMAHGQKRVSLKLLAPVMQYDHTVRRLSPQFNFILCLINEHNLLEHALH
jgi:hypothetical protein